MSEKQKIILPNKFNFVQNNNSKNLSMHIDKKFNIIKFATDESKGSVFSKEPESKFIYIRNDIYDSLSQIKQFLNNYDIPLSCEYIDVSLENNNIDDFQRLGLCISLNTSTGLNNQSSYDNDDYFVGPLEKDSIQVYGLVRRDINIYKNKLSPVKDIYKIYSIKETYRNNKPNIINVYKNFINITNLFYSFGFYQIKPEKMFFEKSIYEKSNWNKFYKTLYLKDGQSYKDLLKETYTKNNSIVWSQPDRYWNGSKFSG